MTANPSAAVKALLDQLMRQGALPGLPLVTIGGPTVVAGGGNAAPSMSVSNAASTVSVSRSSQPAQQPRVTVPSASASSTERAQIEYAYKVRIINPNKKSEVCVQHLNDCSIQFDTLTALRVKLVEAFKTSIPNTLDFNVGYYEGSQKSKVSLVDTEDLKTMYGSFPKGGTTTLWCDSRVEQSDTRKRKKDTDSFSRRNAIEENEAVVEETYQTLLDKHGQKYDTPRLRLWALCICSEQQQSYDNTPALPSFHGATTQEA